MEHTGNLVKMEAEYDHLEERPGRVVQYFLHLGEDRILVNDLIGRVLQLRYTHEIHCMHCGRLTKTSFAQGYCYPCFISLPETDDCVLKPELCRAHEGISRDMAWSQGHCLQEHVVYLALTPGLKVGVTRESQVPVRWIDQGAWAAIRLARTPNRYLAGTMEVALKQHYQDKTNWRSMLKGDPAKETDLVIEKERAAGLLPHELRKYLDEDDRITRIRYPVEQYPEKIVALSLDRQDEYNGILAGIRGQYLIFPDGTVFNIRRHGGYRLSLSY